MDFAKGILEKYGWKEGKYIEYYLNITKCVHCVYWICIFVWIAGQGIGRHSDGIVKPVKASLKFDTAGLGHDKAVEFNNHWWEKAFNDAANNINVQNASDKTSLSLNNSESVEVYSTNKYLKHSTRDTILLQLSSYSTRPMDILPNNLQSNEQEQNHTRAHSRKVEYSMDSPGPKLVTMIVMTPMLMHQRQSASIRCWTTKNYWKHAVAEQHTSEYFAKHFLCR